MDNDDRFDYFHENWRDILEAEAEWEEHVKELREKEESAK